MHVSPYRGMDVRAGKAGPWMSESGGVSGIILDGRRGPLIARGPPERADALTRWFQAMDAYPMDEVRELRTQFPVKASSGKGGKKRGGFFGFLRPD